MASSAVNLDELLTKYFHSGRSYKAIVIRLENVHGIKRSVRWLKKQFQRLHLYRRGGYTPDSIVRNCVRCELRSSNSLGGYRRMWHILRQKYRLKVRRDTVMTIMRVLDPQGIAARAQHKIIRRVYTSKGPNFAWHIDQYDKLCAFGFKIHGCIDGFSRKVLWLKVAPTNRDPAVILGYYLECVANHGGCPRVIRIDKGSENVFITESQIAFRLHHGDSLAAEKSVRVGSSPTNSRIESWWSRLRMLKLDWWISALKDLEHSGDFDPMSDVHCLHYTDARTVCQISKCLAVVLSSIIQRELDDFVSYWNSHSIRPNRLAECPSGRPDDLFEMPQEFGGEEQLCPVNRTLWLHYSLSVKKSPPPFFDTHFYSTCNSMCMHKYGVDLHQGIDSVNWKEVFKYLQNNVSF